MRHVTVRTHAHARAFGRLTRRAPRHHLFGDRQVLQEAVYGCFAGYLIYYLTARKSLANATLRRLTTLMIKPRTAPQGWLHPPRHGLYRPRGHALQAGLHRSLQRAGGRVAAPAGRGLAARRRPRPVATGATQGTGRRQGRHVAEGAPAQGLRRSVEPLRPALRDRQVHATAAGEDGRGRGVFDRAGAQDSGPRPARYEELAALRKL